MDQKIIKPAHDSQIEMRALSLLPDKAAELRETYRTLLSSAQFGAAARAQQTEILAALLATCMPGETLSEMRETLHAKKNVVYQISGLPTTPEYDLQARDRIKYVDLPIGHLCQAMLLLLEAPAQSMALLLREPGDREKRVRIEGASWHHDGSFITALGTEINLEGAPTGFRNFTAMLKDMSERTKRLLAGNLNREFTGDARLLNYTLHERVAKLDINPDRRLMLPTEDRDAVEEWIATAAKHSIYPSGQSGSVFFWTNNGEFYHRGEYGMNAIPSGCTWSRVSTLAFGRTKSL